LSWFLIPNKHEQGNLLKNAANIDFLFVIKGNYEHLDKEQIILQIRKIPDILFVHEAEHDKLKNIYDILEMIEITMIDKSKKRY
jgi:hypothetical protein